MYLSRPGSVPGDINGLLNYTMSPDYYDNWMVSSWISNQILLAAAITLTFMTSCTYYGTKTRMIANIPHSQVVTEQDFIEARKILENKFLIGMSSDLAETVVKRIKLYFGWKELPTRNGCEIEYINQAKVSTPQLYLKELSHEWRQIRKANHFDSKLYARAQAMFAKQKMNMPVHELVSSAEKSVATMSVQNLLDVKEPLEKSDIPFFW